MKILEILFWFCLFIMFYSYIGYGILLYFLVGIKSLFTINNKSSYNPDYEPEVTLLVTAYNEKDFVEAKVKNSFDLDYPKDKIKYLWITDGSDDGTPEILKQYKNIKVYHQNERCGKIAAMNRGIKFVDTPIVIFSDANTNLGKNSVKEIVKMFSNPKVGCVSGEKRIYSNKTDTASGAGESLYWKYESTLKKWDAKLYSAVGAAGELFAIRTALYQELESDTLLDDFIISLRIAMKGYTIQYNPDAYAIETASANVKEELKRKIRISAGGLQSVIRLTPLLNPFKYGVLSFQYISHRVLRWTLSPLALLMISPLNIILVLKSGYFLSSDFYAVLLSGQILFYLSVLIGWLVENYKTRIKALFVPYYFFIMNFSVFLGFYRLITSQQSVKWERAKRAQLV
ncbi:MAG: glycosyltransferase family 2 protein [Bacteroidales bacterium]|nr:glycosyltransferase family 2 protein [Bacteroidales bacterium]